MASDYGKAIADTIRGIKSDFEGKSPKVDHSNTDQSVREAVNVELDGLIQKHDERKTFPPIL